MSSIGTGVSRTSALTRAHLFLIHLVVRPTLLFYFLSAVVTLKQSVQLYEPHWILNRTVALQQVAVF